MAQGLILLFLHINLHIIKILVKVIYQHILKILLADQYHHLFQIHQIICLIEVEVVLEEELTHFPLTLICPLLITINMYPNLILIIHNM